MIKAEKIEIKSKDNEKIKILKKLGQKKYRDQLAVFLVENLSIIYDALRAGIVFESLFVTEGFIKKNKEKFDFILKNAKEYYLIDEKINKSFSGLETPSGICAIYKKQGRESDFTKPIIYLNGIGDPGNLGTILRSALAFNLKNIVIDEKCADIYNFKTVNSAKDAIFKLNIVFDKNREILKEIKKKMLIFSTEVKNGKEIKDIKNKKLFCLVLGSEAHGVDKEILEMSDDFITIKTSGEIESLNVASAAAIIFSSL